MYSLFDSVFDVPFGYSIPRHRVVVIPDSQYNKLRAQENERQVAKLEARKEHHSQVSALTSRSANCKLHYQQLSQTKS